MRAKCRRLKAEHGLGLVVVDYLQLMRSHRNMENRVQEISEIARGLKSLARELKVPVIALSQLSRAVEKREDKRPMLSDLRESGSIEAEADMVMMLYRPDYYRDQRESSDTEAIAGTRRLGYRPGQAQRGDHRDHHRQAPKRPDRNGEDRLRERVRIVREPCEVREVDSRESGRESRYGRSETECGEWK